jgi:hypothetical protein
MIGCDVPASVSLGHSVQPIDLGRKLLSIIKIIKTAEPPSYRPEEKLCMPAAGPRTIQPVAGPARLPRLPSQNGPAVQGHPQVSVSGALKRHVFIES